MEGGGHLKKQAVFVPRCRKLFTPPSFTRLRFVSLQLAPSDCRNRTFTLLSLAISTLASDKKWSRTRDRLRNGRSVQWRGRFVGGVTVLYRRHQTRCLVSNFQSTSQHLNLSTSQHLSSTKSTNIIETTKRDNDWEGQQPFGFIKVGLPTA